MTFGKELIQSAMEALAIAKGKAEPAAVYHPQGENFAAIQKRGCGGWIQSLAGRKDVSG